MLWYMIIGFLAAFGALCALWVTLGAWLTEPAMGHIVIRPAPGREEAAVRRYTWLRNLGLVKGRLTVVTAAPPVGHWDAEFLTPEQYLSRLTEEREKFDGV